MRPGLVVAVAVVAAAAAVNIAGAADAQNMATFTVSPSETDPGATVVVANSPVSPCPTNGAANPSASVGLYAVGSLTAKQIYQGPVTPAGTWSVEVKLAADLSPGRYTVQARCYTDSGLSSQLLPDYAAGRLDLRLQSPTQPTATPSHGLPGDTVQISSEGSRCPPPQGALGPRVRVSMLDSVGATLAEAEGSVDSVGQWSLPLRVPQVDAQNTQVTAACLAQVGASAPYARYAAAPFVVQAVTTTEPSTTTTTARPTVPGAPTTASTTNPVTIPAASLPLTPVAIPIIAEPTYTG